MLQDERESVCGWGLHGPILSTETTEGEGLFTQLQADAAGANYDRNHIDDEVWG